MSIEQAKEWLAQAESVAVLIGAGVSAESGIPTFRDSGGLWRNFRPEDLATPQAFHRDPTLVWEWYEWRRNLVRNCRPNPAHEALAVLDAGKPRFLLITQNVDRLEERAGAKRIARLHGSIWDVRCTACSHSDIIYGPFEELPPRCGCGGILRPGVVWFGEALPRQQWDAAYRAATTAELFLVAGTSAVVYPAAGLVAAARDSGARVIEVNLEATGHTLAAHVALRGPAGVIFRELAA